MRTVLSFLLIVFCWLFACEPAAAQKRAALVIGNAQYRSVPHLANPVNDARDIAALFKSAGFAVDMRLNLGIGDLRRAVRDFSESARDADIAVVYFAGHGIEVDGGNYIIPVDAKLGRDFDVEDETVSLDRILKAMESAKRLRLVILDACRDNPFLKTMKRSIASRSVGRGLAKIEPPVGDTLVAFAAKAGSIALDGNARNSPFTAALINNIAEPGLDLRIALGKVRDEVLKTTDRGQEPFVYGSLGGSIIAIVNAPPAPKVVAPKAPATDEIVWNTVKDAGHPAVFADFIAKFPDSKFRAAADARRDELQRRSDEAAAAAAPATDEIVWNAIKDSSHAAVHEEFLAKFPASKHAAAAGARADELKQRQTAAVTPPSAPAEVKAPAPASRINLGLKVLSDAEERALKPKSAFRECDKCPELVVAPAGSFMMGSAESERSREPIEGPQRLVTFAAPFAVGRFAVTFEEWDACLADGGCNGYRPWDNGWGRGKRPVINVSWHDARAYVAWLSNRTGKTYRLLSEAEREYVARAGTTTPYWWGSSITRRNANFNDGAKDGGKKVPAQPQKTQPVDAFQANAWGLHQVHGNVWEWVDDCMLDTYAGASADGLPRTKEPCDRRVLRGGSWITEAVLLRSASRYGVQPEGRVSNVGFRVARTLNTNR